MQASGISCVPSFICRQVPTLESKHHFELSSASSFMKAYWSFLLQIESTEPNHIFQRGKYISACVGSSWDGVNFPIAALMVLCFALAAGKVLVKQRCLVVLETRLLSTPPLWWALGGQVLGRGPGQIHMLNTYIKKALKKGEIQAPVTIKSFTLFIFFYITITSFSKEEKIVKLLDLFKQIILNKIAHLQKAFLNLKI